VLGPNYAFKPIAEQALCSNQNIVPQRLNAALDLMATIPELRQLIEESPSWRRVLSGIVGGLTEVGLSQDEGHLLIVSHSGRGLYDLLQRLRVARDGSVPALSSPWISEANRLVRGIGPRADEWFECVGLWGGALASSLGPDVSVEVRGEGDVEVALLRDGSCVWEITRAITEMRVFGFSRSGSLLVFAASGEFSVFERFES